MLNSLRSGRIGWYSWAELLRNKAQPIPSGHAYSEMIVLRTPETGDFWVIFLQSELGELEKGE